MKVRIVFATANAVRRHACKSGQRDPRQLRSTMKSLYVLAEAVCRFDKCADDTGLGRGVAGVRDDIQRCFGPGAVQIPGVHDRTNDVVATVNDYRWNVSNTIDVVEQVVVGLEETVIDEVMTLNPR